MSNVRLIYVPVSTGSDCLINEYHPHTLFNPIRQNFDTLKKIVRTDKAENFADSGGLQLISYENDPEKSAIVIPGVGIKNRKDIIVIDPIDLCRCYGKLNIKYGFTLDHPISDIASVSECNERLENSYGWAALMFDVRKELCPNTEFLIPLQFMTKPQLHKYFEKMESLNPDGYAFPARGKINFAKSINIACTLSFLHSKQVAKVHMLGSSRREVIIIAVATVGLKMFNQLSFDSRTWNTANFNRKPIKIDSADLNQKKINPGEKVNLSLPRKLLENLSLYDPQYFKKLLLLHNAFAISEYAKNLSEIATDISSLKYHLSSQKLNGQMPERILAAIDVLETYSQRGYSYIEKWLSWIW
jgi:queuine/archaeosine tRNA-ribosyltransferase